ncbi:amidase signature domain-containing protein [Aspergillus insuetus]
MSSNWEQLAADKRERLAKTIALQWRMKELPRDDSVLDYPRTAGILSEGELEITELSATQLVSKLASNRLSAVETNCVHEFFPEAALAQAKELDDCGSMREAISNRLEQYTTESKGYETSMGYISFLGKYDKKDSVMTHLLRKAGTVFYVKTSVPQTLLVCETVNNIIGTTTNPRNRHWSCGGSSGGEGVMLALRESVLGVGTDISRSIRVPAAFNYLYGLRPSHGRLAYAKMANSMEGQETVHIVVGPIGHSVAGPSSSRSRGSLNPMFIPMPWRQSEADVVRAKIHSGVLTVGVYSFDENVLPHPPVLREIRLAADALRKNGHTAVPWTPYKHDYGCELVNRIWAVDASTDVLKDIKAS